MADCPRSIQLSVRVYEVLIKAYPASFRAEYGNEMTQVFCDLATDALGQRGVVGLVAAWFRVLGDLAWTAPQQHYYELQGRIQMKTAAAAVLSVLLAAIVHLYVFAFVAMTMGAPLLMIGRSPLVELAIVYVPAFLTGMILARVKPLFMPMVTAPLGAMALWAPAAFQDHGPGWCVRLGYVASIGLASLLGCVLATKLSSRLGKPGEATQRRVVRPVPLLFFVGTLAVFVCTSAIGCVLWIVLAGNELGPLMRPALLMCLLALLLIAAATIANLAFFAVRACRKTELG